MTAPHLHRATRGPGSERLLCPLERALMPLALTACHYVRWELVVMQHIQVRGVNKDGKFENKWIFANVSLKIFTLLFIRA